jgi:hypothetical protein
VVSRQKFLYDPTNETKVHKLISTSDLCTRFKKIFTHEQTLFNSTQLTKHYKFGDKAINKDDDSGFKGHPECAFCKSSFYGDDELFEHCRDKHEQCHICVRNGIRHQYYANYDQLVRFISTFVRSESVKVSNRNTFQSTIIGKAFQQ